MKMVYAEGTEYADKPGCSACKHLSNNPRRGDVWQANHCVLSKHYF